MHDYRNSIGQIIRAHDIMINLQGKERGISTFGQIREYFSTTEC